ncbi:MAG: molybdenum cofactor biosynthesis protein MoaE [Phycisphaerales bacterium]|nr:MAG: molybdenum cofactor biosynthesis protein MoaE [Phycisphaerales bacterium]
MDETDAVIDVRLCDGTVDYRRVGSFPPQAGAECVFLGRTRRDRHPKHGQLVRLEYEAYQPLAERVLRELAAEAVARFGCLMVRVHHAVREVPPGEASVLVQVACPHRSEAFEACRFLIDELKARSPIWKRQIWADGAAWSEGRVVSTPEDDG